MTATLFHWKSTGPIENATEFGNEARDGRVVDAPEDEADVLEEKGHPHRGDQRGDPGRIAQRPVGDELDSRVEGRPEEHRDGERGDDPEHDHARRVRDGEVEDGDDHRAGDQAAEREHVPVREVDQLQDSVDERVAERDQAVDGAVRDPDQQHVQELARILDEVADHPDHDKHDERRSHDADHARGDEPAKGGQRGVGAGLGADAVAWSQSGAKGERFGGGLAPSPEPVLRDRRYVPRAASTFSGFGESVFSVTSLSVAL